jgi:hypothetical protein
LIDKIAAFHQTKQEDAAKREIKIRKEHINNTHMKLEGT